MATRSSWVGGVSGRERTSWRCCWSTRPPPYVWHGGSATRSSAKGISTPRESESWPLAYGSATSTSAGRSAPCCGRVPSTRDAAGRGRVVSPIEFVVSAVRALELFDPPPSMLLLAEWATRLGQDLFYPPNVGGWTGGRSWLSAGRTDRPDQFCHRGWLEVATSACPARRTSSP